MKTCLLLLLLLLFASVSAATVKRNTRRRAPWTTTTTSHTTAIAPLFSHGNGGNPEIISTQQNTTANTLLIQAYVTAVEERDRGGNTWDDARDNAADGADGATAAAAAEPPPTSSAEEHAILGIKEHNKKSNAVGDPDSDSDDDDDDGDDDSETEEWQDLDEFMSANNNNNHNNDHQVQVQVELVSKDVPDENEDATKAPSSSSSSGGVRLGRRKKLKPRRVSSPTAASARHAMDEAWWPHIYVPPSKRAVDTLVRQARAVHAFEKSRLDRRTLYAGLLLEWQQPAAAGNAQARRKFLSRTASQTLQAALSLATQPHWRQAAPQSSGITLYKNAAQQTSAATTTTTTTTLAMQETIAMALAHSLGCGMVILDDEVLEHVKKSCGGGNIKPAVLLESLLSSSTNKRPRTDSNATASGGSIASMMERDLEQGLDDPFDERAIISKDEMKEWEQEWHDDGVSTAEPLPLVVFIRTEASPSLLKSKSAMEYLQQECTSSDSVHLLVLGKGIDATTETLPPLPETTNDLTSSMRSQQQQLPHMEPMDGRSPPWFGFTPQNQNASGQNDPEGSRRFNIFLARTMDGAGHMGILGAIAQPQAGNLFPHMMAIQARERMQQQHDPGSPVKAELDRWTQLLQQQMQSNGGTPLPPPQFFNASLAAQYGQEQNPLLPPATAMPPPEVVQQALQHAMTEMLDRLAEINTDDDDEANEGLSPELHKAFAQVLQNENLRRGIAENLARAAPALSDPKCQGVMLSVYVPPPPTHQNHGKLPSQPQKPPGGWFHKILNHHDDGEEDQEEDSDDERTFTSRKNRVRTMAAAMASKEKSESSGKAERNLSKLESLCRPVPIQSPADPVRQKSWEGWIARERGAVIFRHNRRALSHELALRNLSLEQHTGTRGAGSALRQMLSVRDISDHVENVVKCAVELEAAKSRRHQESDGVTPEQDLDVDMSLSQLLLNKDGSVQEATENVAAGRPKRKAKSDVKLLHPSSLETALTMVCRISPSPSGGLSLSSQPASHRSREDISALAQDKHERALISQVVSPQDIGVTYDMIGGLTDVKELLRQSITYPLKFPHLYSEGIAREAVKGVLLFGPPGTGKTMLAKAVATEGGASFLSVDASSVENKWLGESEKNAKAVFTLARRLAPCVIFIDEVDSLLSSREGSSDDSAHGTLTSVKTTMMSEWDGLNSGTNGLGEAGSDRVVVIGSTNRPFDLDEAVLRRFPRRILVDLPDLDTRKEILEVTLAENRVDPAVNLTQIAERLDGYTGSDIKEVCREAVVQISHEQARLLDQGGLSNSGEDVTQGMLQRLRPVTMDDFEKALNKLKRSVSEKGRELARVWEWNDEYGEIKKDSKNHLPQLMNMYL
jgi:SpoVK/Ycf46/Vps4 family AAA+-type ATPase